MRRSPYAWSAATASNAASNAQHATPATVSVSTSGGLAASSSSGSGSQKEAMMKKLKEIQDAREALMKKEEEIMRQLGT